MEFKLTKIENVKLERHNGAFTRSYQEVRAKYDANIRNWNITYANDLFIVEDNDKNIEKVYLDRQIANCSCEWFINTQCGTCMHIEAIHRTELSIFTYPCKRPITFLTLDNRVLTIGKKELAFETPSISTFNKLKLEKLGYYDQKITDIDVFKDEGIILYNFQKESVVLMIKNMRSILVLKMGLGKTLCSLACCKILNKSKVLIVVPNSLKMQWEREINRFKLGIPFIISKGKDAFLAGLPAINFVIVSYELLNRHKEILDNKFDIVILDEVQKVKNADSVSWQTIAEIKSDFVFALSGTPIQNNINDLLSLIKILNYSELKPEWKFYEEFCNVSKAKIFGINPQKVNELRDKFARYIINPTVNYDLFKMPKVNKEETKANLTGKQVDLHDRYFEPAKLLIAKSITKPLSFGEMQMLNGLLTTAFMAVVDARLIQPEADKSERFSMIEEMILELVSEGKVVVYSQWIKSLNLLVPFLIENNIKYTMFHGMINVKKRNENLMKFIEEEEVKVFLSTDSGGLGIDGLQLACNNVIHIENLWNIMKIEQRNGRLVRALQKNEVVNIYSFSTNSGIEEMMAINHERKVKTISDMLG